jgi:hypothetical protein
MRKEPSFAAGDDKLAVTVPKAAALVDVSRSTGHQLVASGEWPAMGGSLPRTDRMPKPADPPPANEARQLRLPLVEEQSCPHCDTAVSFSSPNCDRSRRTFNCPSDVRRWTATTRESRR